MSLPLQVHPWIFALAARLLRGEIVGFADDHGRRWRASAHVLTCDLWGAEFSQWVEQDAFAVAYEALYRGWTPEREIVTRTREGICATERPPGQDASPIQESVDLEDPQEDQPVFSF